MAFVSESEGVKTWRSVAGAKQNLHESDEEPNFCPFNIYALIKCQTMIHCKNEWMVLRTVKDENQFEQEMFGMWQDQLWMDVMNSSVGVSDNFKDGRV